ncbi:hypothetical protein [Microbacterium sp. 1P06AB]|uniref:hypothetical protein n=1 Tax=Microbacterium sp. 1P06AB TaxID=3132289 RepID=UPI0039A62935
MTELLRPVVVIDIDYVVRIPNSKPGLEFRENVRTAEIVMRAGAVPTLHHSQPPWDSEGLWRATHSFSGIAVDWIHHLLDRGIEVYWASTWREYANMYFSPILGLPDLPLALIDDGYRDERQAAWKARQVVELAPGQPLLWIDDNIPRGDVDWVVSRRSQERSARTHFHRTRERAVGFSRSDEEVCSRLLATWRHI